MNPLPTTLDGVLEHNARHAGGSQLIFYGGLTLAAPKSDVEEAVGLMRLLTGPARKQHMNSINATLARNFPKVKAGKASQKLAMQTAQDLVLWFANEVIEGRASEKES